MWRKIGHYIWFADLTPYKHNFQSLAQHKHDDYKLTRSYRQVSQQRGFTGEIMHSPYTQMRWWDHFGRQLQQWRQTGKKIHLQYTKMRWWDREEVKAGGIEGWGHAIIPLLYCRIQLRFLFVARSKMFYVHIWQCSIGFKWNCIIQLKAKKRQTGITSPLLHLTLSKGCWGLNAIKLWCVNSFPFLPFLVCMVSSCHHKVMATFSPIRRVDKNH